MSLRSAQCIYCQSKLDDSTRLAHVFPECLGGRIASRTICCNKCNESFSPIEEEAKNRLGLISAISGARRGDKKLIHSETKIFGKTYHVEGARADELAPPPRDEGRVWPMPARRDHQVRRIAIALLQRGLPAEAMLDGRFVFEHDTDKALAEDDSHEEPTDSEAVQHEPLFDNIIWCDRPTDRLMAKIALELLAYIAPLCEISCDLTDALEFARYDRGLIHGEVDTETSGSRLLKVDAELVHCFEIWTYKSKLSYALTLFAHLKYVATISEHWYWKPFRASYSFDITNPTNCMLISDGEDGDPLVNKSRRVRRKELEVACQDFQLASFRRSSKQIIQAPPPDAGDLFPDVVIEMAKRSR